MVLALPTFNHRENGSGSYTGYELKITGRKPEGKKKWKAGAGKSDLRHGREFAPPASVGMVDLRVFTQAQMSRRALVRDTTTGSHGNLINSEARRG